MNFLIIALWNKFVTRGAQILAKYPKLQIKWIRGNIDTRLNKLETEDYDAIILAAAGLNVWVGLMISSRAI